MKILISIITLTLLISCGSENLELEAKDKLGSSAEENTNSTPSNSSIFVTISTLANAGAVNEATYSLSGTCSEDGQVVQVAVGSINLTPSCSSGSWNVASIDISALADGVIAVAADHSDGTNNAPQATGSFSKNLNIPVVTINTPAVINIANVASYSLSGICSEEAQAVTLSIGGIAQTPTCQASKSWSITGLDVSSLSDGPITITADHSDIFSNTAVQASTTVTMDTGAPSVTINALTPINLANESTYSLDGTCSENTESVSVSIGGIAQTPTCTGGNWTITNLDVSGLTDGSITITADHNDAVTNPATQASSSVQMDTIAPSVGITTPANITNANKASFNVSGSCSEDTRQVSVSIGGIAQTPTCTGGAWNVTGLDLTSVADGVISITADHDDALANPATQASLVVSKTSELVTYDFVGTSNYTFDTNYVELKVGKAALKTIDLEHQGHEFSSGGSHVGSYYSSSRITLKSKIETDLSVDSILSSKAGNLVGYWKMEGNMQDSSPSGDHCTEINSPPFSSGKIGTGSVYFNNINQRGECGNATSVSEFTTSAWVKVDTNAADINSTAGQIISRLNTLHNFWFNIENGKLNSGFHNDSNYLWTHSNVLVWEPGRWYHVAATYHPASGEHKLFRDGVELSQSISNTTGTPRACPECSTVIGGDSGGNNFGGEIDEVSLWNTRLSPTDISLLYNAQSPIFSDEKDLSPLWTPQWSSLVGYWKMDGNWQDSSGNGNHGTAVGDATITASSKIGSGAGSFDGTGDYISATLPSPSDSDYSASLWFKTSSTGDEKIISTNSASPIQIFSGKLRSCLVSCVVGSTTINDDQWHHVFLRCESNICSLYLDGNTTPELSTTAKAFSTSLYVGAYDGGGVYFFNGEIDELAIWSNDLSLSEGNLIYNRQKQKYAGHYESPIINMGASTAPTTLEWLTDLPFMKELPQASESSTDYVTLVGSTGSTTDNDLMSGIVGLWHLNEVVLGTAPGGLDAIDSSGNGGHGSSCVAGDCELGKNGVLGKSYNSTLSSRGVNILDAVAPNPVNELSVSIWVKSLLSNISAWSLVAGKYTAAEGWRVQRFGGGENLIVNINTDLGINQQMTSNSKALDGSLHHVALTLENGIMKLYIDGVLDNSATYSHGTGVASTGNLGFGAMGGMIDEAAMWNRALNPSEITQLYRRGANRLKVQVRTCDDSTCSSNEEWQGPDNSNGEFYFSELNNCSVLTASGTCDFANSGEVNTFLPDFDLSGAGQFTNYVLAQPQKQYFQYRVLMESDDESATPTFPSLTSIDFGTKYFGGSPSVVTNTPQAYTALYNFSVTKTGACEPKYQLARNGAYYYFSAGNWIAATDDVAEANTEAEVSANIAQFVTDQGAGNLTVRTYLQSDTDQACSIDEIQITGEN